MKLQKLLCGFALFAMSSLSAQGYTDKEVDRMSHLIANTIRDHYVLPEKGNIIADYFLDDLKKGRFYGIATYKKLDSIMCKSLKEISNDAHLYVWNNLDIVKSLKAKENSKEEQSSEDQDQSEDAPNFFNNEKARQSNYGFNKVDILAGNVGYIKLTQINISGESLNRVYAAMALVADTDQLIIDLRDNAGGGSTLGAVLESYFFEKHTQFLEFRHRNGAVELSETVGWILEEKYTKPLYILVNKGTGSAAEAFAFSLQGQKRATVVGESTSGGAYMNDYFPINEQFVLAVSTSAPFLIGTTKSWEGEGVQPDISVNAKDALQKTLDIIKSN